MAMNNVTDNKKKDDNKRYSWKFNRIGAVDQVVLSNADDLRRLPELDLKLWMALSMPTKGLRFDSKTADLIDTDNNGRIHPEEVIEAVRWASEAVNDPEILLKGEGHVPLAAIRDPELAASARQVLKNIGKADAEVISLSDVTDLTRIFSATLFNGDGVVPPEAAEADKDTESFIREVVETLGGKLDRCGRMGVDTELLDKFFADAAAIVEWGNKASDPSISPLGSEATAKALAATQAVRAKVNDFYARCRLASFDERSIPILNRDAEDYRSFASRDMEESSTEIACFPLSQIAPDSPLNLVKGINPVWHDAVATFLTEAVEPLVGHGTTSLTEDEWKALQAKLAAYEKHASIKPDSPVAKLGNDRLLAILSSDLRKRTESLIKRDLALQTESERIAAVEKLVRYCRDLQKLLTNYVNFMGYYGGKGAVFQIGTLFIDGRSCDLCIEVVDEAKQTALSALSGFFIAFCDLTRPGTPTRKILAAVTNGDSDNLMVGRNGIFHDRDGSVWDATITRIVSSPISVREAFWSPYKKFVRMIEEQIAKRVQAADSASTAKMSASLETAFTAPAPAAPDAAAAPGTPATPKKIDLGTIALIGTAIGGISALVGGLLKALFDLGIWLPIGLLGIVLLISGPSMILAALKLRRRNLAPLLDANSWAINTRARVNIPFGTTLTKLAKLPPGTVPSLKDPFKQKKSHWKLWVVLALLAIAGIMWWQGRFDNHLPERFKRFHTPSAVEAVDESVQTDPPPAEPPAEAPVEAPAAETPPAP